MRISKAVKSLSDQQIIDRIKNLREIISEVYDKPSMIKVCSRNEKVTVNLKVSRLGKFELLCLNRFIESMNYSAETKIRQLNDELENRKTK